MDALDPVIEITASCNFANPFPSGMTEVRDWSRPILRVAGRYFVCAIRVAGAPIRAGDKREIIIRAIDDGGLVRAVEETRSVELMAGARLVVAHGDVLSFQVVST